MIQNEAFNETNSQQKTGFTQSTDFNALLTSRQADDEALIGAICPNCGARLEGRKCKLLCPTWGCGYMVTCSEW